MSKVYVEQVEKAQSLANGLRQKFDLVKELGISLEQIEQLEKEAQVIDGYNRELEELRAKVSEKASVASKKLTEVRTNITSLKQIVKRNFAQERWIEFGIADKR